MICYIKRYLQKRPRCKFLVREVDSGPPESEINAPSSRVWCVNPQKIIYTKPPTWNNSPIMSITPLQEVLKWLLFPARCAEIVQHTRLRSGRVCWMQPTTPIGSPISLLGQVNKKTCERPKGSKPIFSVFSLNCQSTWYRLAPANKNSINLTWTQLLFLNMAWWSSCSSVIACRVQNSRRIEFTGGVVSGGLVT